ncbi:Ntn hydrolase family protein [Methylomarinum vadi]|uniref:hypothetical protein n=1 Tax=Methylomarinum vadi TaxID=438855 RepID=UPI0004DF99B3|nr:hypothetical protein [Methylomarinum vadi]
MTIGFGAIAWNEEVGRIVAVAADSRLSHNGNTISDAGVKTFELGGSSAMVVAGNALPAISAADIVRQIVDNHNRKSDKRMGFYDTTRLLAFFLKRACEPESWCCKATVVGFLDNGLPSLSIVIISKIENSVRFFNVEKGGSIFFPVGTAEACDFIRQGFELAKKEGKSLISTGLSLIYYMSELSAFPTIGGAISLGCCNYGDQYFSWPHISIDDRLFYRGIDLTENARPTWPMAERIEYDQEWCSKLDVRLHQDVEPIQEVVTAPGCIYQIDDLSTPETLFQLHNDPTEFVSGVAREH